MGQLEAERAAAAAIAELLANPQVVTEHRAIEESVEDERVVARNRREMLIVDVQREQMFAELVADSDSDDNTPWIRHAANDHEASGSGKAPAVIELSFDEE